MAQYRSLEYKKVLDFSTSLRGEQIIYFSKPGLPNWDSISPSISLLAKHIDIPSNSEVLILGCGHGALATALAKTAQDSQFQLMDQNFIALEMSRKTIECNLIKNVIVSDKISLLPEKTKHFDLVVLDLPKGRRLAQRWLVEAFTVLRPNGKLYLAGSNKQGIRAVMKDAQALFGNVSILDYKKGNRLAQLIRPVNIKPQVSWAYKPGIAPDTWVHLVVDSPQGHFELASLPGIFSYDRLDPGTGLLLSCLSGVTNQCILDLGCGYGILGLASLADGADWVDMVDSNLLAVAAAGKNLNALGFSNAEAIPNDVLSNITWKLYDLIVSNPPFHSGREVNYQITNAFIQQSYEALNDAGRMLIVANQFIRYDRAMSKIFGDVSLIAKDGRYQVWQATK